jgi:hypothetical protein
MASDDLFSIVNAPSGSGTPASGRGVSLAAAFLSPGGVPVEVISSTLSDQPVQWGPSLVLIRDHTKICGGQYGVKKNNCLCCVVTAEKKECPSRHVLVKHWMTDTSEWVHSSRIYYHKGSTSGAVYAEPFVDVSAWKEDEVASVLGRQFSAWSHWKEEAIVMQSSGASRGAVAMVRTAVKLSKHLPRLDYANGPSESDMMLDGPAELTKEESTSNYHADWLNTLRQTSRLSAEELFGPVTIERINFIQDSLATFGDLTSAKLKALQVGWGIRLSDLEFQVGTRPSLDIGSQLDGTSVWSLLEDLQTQIEDLKGGDYARGLADKVMQTETFTSHHEKVRDAFKAVMQRILPMESKVHALETQVTSDEKIDGLDWLGLRSKGTTQGMTTGNVGDDERIQSLCDRIATLEMSMNPGQSSEGEDISVSFMGVRFSSEDDVRSYVESLSGGKFAITAGLMTDCYAIFHALNREIFDTKNKLSMIDLAKVSNLGAKQIDVYHMLAAAEHGLPEFFDSSPSGKVFIDGKQGKKHRFNNLASYEIWGPVGTLNDAVRRKAEVQLARFVKTKRIAIQELANPELVTFLNGMLNASKDFVEAVFSFLTEEYAALAEHFSDGVLCWDFACSCVEHVFKYEFEAARAVISSPEVGDTTIHSKVLWQSLRTIAVQESFLRVGFKNHSSLASAYSRFLLTQYQKTALELSRVSKEAELRKTKLTEVVSTVDSLDKRVRAAEGTANSAKNALERLSKKDGRNGST